MTEKLERKENRLLLCVLCVLCVSVVIFSCLFFAPDSFALEFEVGEELIYDVKILDVKVGIQKMRCNALIDYQGQKAYQLKSETDSTSFFSLFYKVCNRLESIVDAKTFLPFYFEEDTLEGGRKEKIKVEFDQKNLLAKVEKDKIKEIKLPAPTFDILSLTYFLRTKSLELGDTLQIIILTKGRPGKINVEVVKTEEIKTPLGKFKTIMAKRKDKGKHIAFWFSQDSRRIPVKIEVETQIGILSAVLKNIKEGVVK